MSGAVRNICLALLLAAALGAFTHRYKSFESSNELSRLYLASAIAEEGVFYIDNVIGKWGDITDKSSHGGRYYSDKAPGASFLALPAALILRVVTGGTGLFLPRDDALSFVRIITVILPSIFFLLYILGAFGESPLKKFAGSETAVTGAVLVYAFCTPAWVYSTLLYGHQLAAMAGFTSYLILRNFDKEKNSGAEIRFFLAGFLAGLCPVIEYPCVWISACLVLYAVFTEPKRSPFFFAGLILPLIVAGFYNEAAFGSPFATGYSFKVYARDAGFHEGPLWGIGLPSFETLVGIMASRKRGLFFYSPVLAAAFAGFVRMARSSHFRKDFLLCLAIAMGHTFIIAGFKDWTAGWSFGARHLVPMLPFFIPPLIVVFDKGTIAEKTVASGLAGVSVVNHVLAISTFVHVPVQLKNPLTDLFIALFRAGDLSPVLGNGGRTAGAILALGLSVVLMVTISYSIARAHSKPVRAAAVFVSIAAVLLWLVIFTGMNPQEDDEKHFAMSQVYAAVGDIESAKKELKPMTLPFKPRDLRLYAAYTLWKIAEDEGDIKSALMWRRLYMRLIGMSDDELKNEEAP